MARLCLLIPLLALAIPAFAKPHNERQPISCDELWAAVTDTLGDTHNYRISALDSEQMRANFIVVGAVFAATNTVQLKPHTSGCEMQLRIGFTGADDESTFRSRIKRALKKLDAGKADTQCATPEAQ